MIKNGLIYNDKEISFPNDCSWSRGTALETSVRRCRDNTKTAQEITRRRHINASNYTCSYSLNYFNCENILMSIYELEDVCGKVCTMVRGGRNAGQVLVTSVSFSLDTDGLGDLSSAGITVNMTDGRLPLKPSKAEIKTLYDGA